MAKRALHNSTKDTATPLAKRRKLSQPAQSPVKQEEVKSENEQDNNASDVEDQVDLVEYDIEKIRLKNLQDNAAFLQNLALDKDFFNFNRRKSRPSLEKREKVLLPSRKSLRLQQIDPAEGLLPDLPGSAVLNNGGDDARLPDGPLPMTEHLNHDFEEKELVCKNFHNKVASLQRDISNKKSLDLEGFLKSLDNMTINEDRVARVVPHRICSVAIHPDKECVLAVAGDEWGRVGFWDVHSNAGQDGVISYRPHSQPVSCLSFHPTNPGRLYSCSYDGTLRCADFEKAVFDEVYPAKEDREVYLNSFAFASANTMLVANSEGEVVQLDCRSNNRRGGKNRWRVVRKDLNCVSVHPTKKNYFLAAANSGTVKLYDLRNMKEKPEALFNFSHWRSVKSAYFSPITGKYILTTCMDDCLRLIGMEIKGNKLMKTMSESDPNRLLVLTTRHDNHTGKGHSHFKAVWHPQREDVFIVGSKASPRRIEMFDNSLKIVKTFEDNNECLASMCSLNVFHPTRNILVGGNSSGELHVFMD